MTPKSLRISLTTILSLLQLSFLPQAYSNANWQGDIRLETGYRWDKINNRVVVFGEGAGVFTSTEAANRVNSYQLGAKAVVAAYCNWIGKASAHYGWLGSGHYDEGGFRGRTRGHTTDASLGVGYNLPVNDCISVVPLVGWSYDRINVRAEHVFVGTLGSEVAVGDIKFHNRFQGPWIGTDIVFKPMPCAWITVGHEFHYASWHGTRELVDGELGALFGTTTGFSSTRKHNNMWGQVFTLDGTYALGCWDVGLNLKYQYWSNAGNGRYKRTRVPVNPAITTQRVIDVDWQSFAVMVHAGYMF